MRLIELRANKKSFHTVTFNPNGITVIAAIKETEDQKKTYNSVGKSLTIALIHFCLGSNSNKEFLKLEDWIFTLDFKIGNEDFTSIRSTINQKEIELNGKKHSLKEFNKILEEKLFRIKDNTKYITFRSLMPRFIRYGEDGYISNDRYIKKENPLSTLLNNAFLLGLDTDLILKKADLREKELNIGKLKAQLNNPEFKAIFGTENKKDLEIKIVELEIVIRRYKKSINEFIIAEDYDSIRKEADKISYTLKNIKNKASKLQIAISNIDKSLEIQPDISKEQIIKLYENARFELGEMVIKKLTELEQFNSQILDNRKRKLIQEKRDFEIQLLEISKTISELGRQEDEKLQYLNSTGALDDYTKLNQALNDNEKRLHSLLQYKKLESDYKLFVEENKKDFTNENIITAKYIEQADDLIKENIILFKYFVERFYSEKNSGITILNNEGKNATRFDIKAKIQDDAGNAVKEVKIFCYDWTILKGKHNHNVNFLFHDSKITGDMDTRQVKTMFEVANNECKLNDFQYIISLNQNVIENLKTEMTSEQHQELVMDRIKLTLSDKSPEEKLLGIQIDLNYE
ncbi:uncharacterized protein YydD (DUF2326 family) [Flavobacterium sp. 28A]|uniref:DUF2326 domain-containing protein n=1 Tax=Flavobacterium sp. 28A TaxID=2735895 RepID=UPI00156EC738|nr:DUF2326 domain-containing protein [Flavobacterium sp. 28A]NRT15902.1 uncharacterized protein YydD (DUF2326 family) [Flavobacterium sp. 28A]